MQFRNEAAQATGWFGRAHRLLERDATDSAAQGYLLLPAVSRSIAAGDARAALEAASRAARIGDRFAEPTVSALARHLQGRVLIQQGRVGDGLALLDEAMVAVTTGELSPVVAGLIYCSVIEGCQEVHALERAREWTLGAGTLVRGAAWHLIAVHLSVPGASRGDPAAAWRVADGA